MYYELIRKFLVKIKGEYEFGKIKLFFIKVVEDLEIK